MALDDPGINKFLVPFDTYFNRSEGRRSGA